MFEKTDFHRLVGSPTDFTQIVTGNRSRSHLSALPHPLYRSVSLLGRNHGIGKVGGSLSRFPVCAVSVLPIKGKSFMERLANTQRQRPVVGYVSFLQLL